MPYTYETFGQLKAELATRLDDSSKIYWTDSELGKYIHSAMRTFQALTGSWRDRMTFNTVMPSTPSNAWYDLTQQTGTLIPYTQKDSDVLSEILFHVIEPQLVAGSYVGSDMFTMADFTNAMQRRRDQFLLETGMVTTQSLVATPGPPINRIPLPDNVIDVRRAAWIDADNKFSTLWKSDEWAAESFQTRWETSPANPPSNFAVATTPPVTLAVIPPPSDVGRIELISVNAGQSLNPGLGVLLGIPDDFAWVVKWGALADLLGREGQSKDTQRAEYCEARWKEGIQVAKIFTSIITSYINGVETYPTDVHALSCYRAGWQNQVGVPDSVALMSWNLIALSNIPDENGPYSVMCDVVRNCPVPVNNGDDVQIGREELEAVLNEAQHIAAFKQGGEEFMQTIPLHQNMMNLAMLRNARLEAAIPFYEVLGNRATRQENDSPRVEA